MSADTVTICAACFQSAHTWWPDDTGCQCSCHLTCHHPRHCAIWRKCSVCHARKPGVTGTPPRCRLCRELAEMPP